MRKQPEAAGRVGREQQLVCKRTSTKIKPICPGCGVFGPTSLVLRWRRETTVFGVSPPPPLVLSLWRTIVIAARVAELTDPPCPALHCPALPHF